MIHLTIADLEFLEFKSRFDYFIDLYNERNCRHPGFIDRYFNEIMVALVVGALVGLFTGFFTIIYFNQLWGRLH
jgi:hypothetical protein